MEQSLGTKSPNWRANETLGQAEQRKFKFCGFFKHVPVRHLLSSLYHVIAQVQMTRVEEHIFVEGKDADCYVGTVVGILN